MKTGDCEKFIGESRFPSRTAPGIRRMFASTAPFAHVRRGNLISIGIISIGIIERAGRSSISESVVRTPSGQCEQLSADKWACRFLRHRWRSYTALKGTEWLASTLQNIPRKPHSLIERRTSMKFETLMLNSFFAACVAICVSTLVAMLA